MKSLVLVRHGQSEFNAALTVDKNSELTVRGCRQAYSAAMYVRDYVTKDWGGFVSPYLRCLQTALPIARMTDIKFSVDIQLAEAMVGSVGAVYIASRSGIFKDFDYPLDTARDGFAFTKESQEQLANRLDSVLAVPVEKVILVTHRDCIYYIIRKVTDLTEKFDIYPGSITIIEDGKLVSVGVQP